MIPSQPLSKEEKEKNICETMLFQQFYRKTCRRFRIDPSMEILRATQATMRSGKRFQRLSLCHHRELSMCHIQVLVRCIKRHPHVTEVLLNHNNVHEVTVKYFLEKMYDVHTLSSIELFGNNLTDKVCQTVQTLLERSKTIKRIKLGDNKITAVGARMLGLGLSKNTSTIQLHLGGNKVGDKGLKLLGESLVRNSSLTSLGLRDNGIGKEGVSHLAKCLMSETTVLADIQLKGNCIGASGSLVLSLALKTNKTLKVLELQGNKLGDEGVRHLCEGLSTNVSVHALNFNANNIGDRGCEHVAVLIASNPIIQTLGMANNGITGRSMTAFSIALEKSSVTGLDFGSNRLGDEGAVALSSAIKQSKTMTSLDLRGCEIRLMGMEALAKAMEINRSICHLDLGSNSSRNKGAVAWSKVFAVNPVLTRLCLTDNLIHQDGGQALAIGLQKNFTLRNFSYGGQGENANRIDSSVRGIIDAIVKENKSHAAELLEKRRKTYFSNLSYRNIDIRRRLSEQKRGLRKGKNFRKPGWLITPIHIITHPMNRRDLDSRLEYVFRQKLLRAENPKFVGFYFIGNVLNTLQKVYPDTLGCVDEVLIVQHAYEDHKYYVHLSQELVKTQIKYVGYERVRPSVSTAPKTVQLSSRRRVMLPKKDYFTPQVQRSRSFNIGGYTRPKITSTPSHLLTRTPNVTPVTPVMTPESPSISPLSPTTMFQRNIGKKLFNSPNKGWGEKKLDEFEETDDDDLEMDSLFLGKWDEKETPDSPKVWNALKKRGGNKTEVKPDNVWEKRMKEKRMNVRNKSPVETNDDFSWGMPLGYKRLEFVHKDESVPSTSSMFVSNQFFTPQPKKKVHTSFVSRTTTKKQKDSIDDLFMSSKVWEAVDWSYDLDLNDGEVKPKW